VALKFIDNLPTIVAWATKIINMFSTVRYFLTDKFWPWLTEAWETFTDEVVGAWHTAIEWKDKVVEAFEKVKSGTTAVWDWLKEKFDWLIEKMTWVKEHASWVTDPIGKLIDTFTGGGNGGGWGGGVDLAAAASGGGDTKGMQVGTIAARNAISGSTGVKIGGGWRKPDGYDEHSSGQAFDVMVGSKAEGDKVLAAALSTPGVDYAIWQQYTWKPDGSHGPKMTDRGNPTQNHMDHVHVHVGATGYPRGGGPSDTGLPRGKNAGPDPGYYSGGGGGSWMSTSAGDMNLMSSSRPLPGANWTRWP